MSKSDNLRDYLADLYEGIAEKKPGASKNPQDFRDEIKAIDTGGTPTGKIRITKNGAYDVAQYAYAEVEIEASSDGGTGGEASLIVDGNTITIVAAAVTVVDDNTISIGA